MSVHDIDMVTEVSHGREGLPGIDLFTDLVDFLSGSLLTSATSNVIQMHEGIQATLSRGVYCTDPQRRSFCTPADDCAGKLLFLLLLIPTLPPTKHNRLISHPRKLNANRWRITDAAVKSANALSVSTLRLTGGSSGSGRGYNATLLETVMRPHRTRMVKIAPSLLDPALAVVFEVAPFRGKPSFFHG